MFGYLIPTTHHIARLLWFHIHNKTAAKSQIQLHFSQEGSISAECYENLCQTFSLHADGKKKQSQVNKGTN